MAVDRRIELATSVELSPRELQLLEFAALGLTDQAIANELGISLATVATYWGRIRIKFGPINRTEIVAKFLEAQSAAIIAERDARIELLESQIQQSSATLGVFEAIFNQGPDPIFVLSDQDEIRFVNSRACVVLGLKPREIIGRPSTEFMADFHIERHRLFFSRFINLATAGFTHVYTSAFLKRPTGEEFEIRVSLATITLGTDRLVVATGRFPDEDYFQERVTRA